MTSCVFPLEAAAPHADVELVVADALVRLDDDAAVGRVVQWLDLEVLAARGGDEQQRDGESSSQLRTHVGQAIRNIGAKIDFV